MAAPETVVHTRFCSTPISTQFGVLHQDEIETMKKLIAVLATAFLAIGIAGVGTVSATAAGETSPTGYADYGCDTTTGTITPGSLTFAAGVDWMGSFNTTFSVYTAGQAFTINPGTYSTAAGNNWSDFEGTVTVWVKDAKDETTTSFSYAKPTSCLRNVAVTPPTWQNYTCDGETVIAGAASVASHDDYEWFVTFANPTTHDTTPLSANTAYKLNKDSFTSAEFGNYTGNVTLTAKNPVAGVALTGTVAFPFSFAIPNCAAPENNDPPAVIPNSITTSHVLTCGAVDITLRNVSPWVYPVTVEVDGVLSYGPTVDNRTNGRFDGPQKDVSKTRTISFAEDTGTHTVRYRVNAGSERDLYVGLPVGEWTTVTVESNCAPPVFEKCQGSATLPVSTNLDTGGWISEGGEYVADGMRFNSATDGYVYFALPTPVTLSALESVAFDATPDYGGLIFYNNDNSVNVHYEPYYSNPLWTNHPDVLPAGGGGQGSAMSGDFSDLLSNPVVTHVAFWVNGGHDVTLHSLTFNCMTQSFAFQAPAPEVVIPRATGQNYTCNIDGLVQGFLSTGPEAGVKWKITFENAYLSHAAGSSMTISSGATYNTLLNAASGVGYEGDLMVRATAQTGFVLDQESPSTWVFTYTKPDCTLPTILPIADPDTDPATGPGTDADPDTAGTGSSTPEASAAAVGAGTAVRAGAQSLASTGADTSGDVFGGSLLLGVGVFMLILGARVRRKFTSN